MVPITAFYAAVLAAFFLWLAKEVIVYRRAQGISLGDRGDKIMLRRMRAFGNCAEYVPLALILMALSELQGAWAPILHLAGAALVAGRLLHASALRSEPQNFKFRVLGMGLTLLTIAALCLVLLASVIL